MFRLACLASCFLFLGCKSNVDHQSTAQISPNAAHVITVDGPRKSGPMHVEVVSTDSPVTVRVYKKKEAEEVDKQMAGELKLLAEQGGAKEISLQFDSPAKEKLRIVIIAAEATTVTVKAKPG